MSSPRDVEVIEIPVDEPALLTWEPVDPLAGAEVVSVSGSGPSDGVYATRVEVAAVDQRLTQVASRARDFRHDQTVASALWHVPHQLGYCPQFTAYLPDGTPIAHGGVTHPIPGEVSEVRWGVPFTGYGYAS